MSAGRRALANTALDLIAMADPRTGEQLAAEQLDSAINMTDRLAAFAVLTSIPSEAREKAISVFGDRFRDEPSYSTNGSRCRPQSPNAGLSTA